MIATEATVAVEDCPGPELPAAPAMDPELLRILESFDALKLPPLSAEVTRYLESGTHGLAQATGKLARLERRESWGGEDGRGNLLDRIQGQLKRGSPWLKGSADRKKSKKDEPAHVQFVNRRYFSGNISPDGWSSPDSSSPPGSTPSSGASSPFGARSPERSPFSDTPTTVLLGLPAPDLKSDPLSLDEQETNLPIATVTEAMDCESVILDNELPAQGIDTTKCVTEDLGLPTHLRCQTSPRPGPQSLPSSPFRSLTPTRSPLGLLSRASRSSPSSPGSVAADRNPAHLEQETVHIERNRGTEPPPLPHRRRNTSGSGLRRALFSVAHSLKSLGHVARPHSPEYGLAKPLPMDAAAVARHLLAPPRKLSPGVMRVIPPIRRRAFSQPLQPTKWSPPVSFQERGSSVEGGPFAWDPQPPATNGGQIESGTEGLGSEQMTMAAVLDEQRLERLREEHERNETEGGNGTEAYAEMETDDGGYFAPTSWKAVSDPIPVPARAARCGTKGVENEDDWMECIDKNVVGAPFWREDDGADEVEKRVVECPVETAGSKEPSGGALEVSVWVASRQSETGGSANLAAASMQTQPVEDENPMTGDFLGGHEAGLDSLEEAPPCRDVRMVANEEQTVLALPPNDVLLSIAVSNYGHVSARSPDHIQAPDRERVSRASAAARALAFDVPPPGESEPAPRRKLTAPTIDVTSPAGESTGQHSLTRSFPPTPESQPPEPTAPPPATQSPETTFPSPASPASLARNLEILRIGAGASARRSPHAAVWHVTSNPEEYETRQLKDALPSIYRDGHFIPRSRSNARVHAQPEPEVTPRDRGVPPSAQQHFKLKWKREPVGAHDAGEGIIDEERYQKALFGSP